jgi:hypothetical protein
MPRDLLDQDSGVQVHAPRRWPKSGFDKKDRPLLRPFVAKAFMRRLQPMLCALPHPRRKIVLISKMVQQRGRSEAGKAEPGTTLFCQTTKLPAWRSCDHSFFRAIRAAGRIGGPLTGRGVQSVGNRVAVVRSWGGLYRGFRRLTMRGDRRLIALVARVRALAWRSSRNQLRRRLGSSRVGQCIGPLTCTEFRHWPTTARDRSLRGQKVARVPVSQRTSQAVPTTTLNPLQFRWSSKLT